MLSPPLPPPPPTLPTSPILYVKPNTNKGQKNAINFPLAPSCFHSPPTNIHPPPLSRYEDLKKKESECKKNPERFRREEKEKKGRDVFAQKSAGKLRL